MIEKQNQHRGLDPKAVKIAAGMRECGELLRKHIVPCDACLVSPRRATELKYGDGRFLKRCETCHLGNRAAVTRADVVVSPAAPRAWVSADVRVSRQKLEAALRGEYITPTPTPKVPARTGPDPAGPAWSGPKQFATRWSETPD